MRYRSLAGVCSLSCLAACWTEKKPATCNPRIQWGEEYVVTVVGRWTDPRPDTSHPYGPTTPSCGTDDLAPGATFTIPIDGISRELRTCADPLCPADFPAPSAPYAGRKTSASAVYLCMSDSRKVQLTPSCEAVRFIGLADKQASNLSASTDGGPGSIPAFVLTRGYEVPAGQEAHLSCAAPEQSFSAEARDTLEPGRWRCSDQFVVNVVKK
jgi:hypothetical protein